MNTADVKANGTAVKGSGISLPSPDTIIDGASFGGGSPYVVHPNMAQRPTLPEDRCELDSATSPTINYALEIGRAFQVQNPLIWKLITNQLPYQMCISETVRNAIESSLNVKHSVTIDIRPALGTDGSIIGYSIRDDGCGMTRQEMKEWLTDMGVSGKKIGAQEHLGLGMKLVAAYQNDSVEIVSWKNNKAHRVILGAVDAAGSRGAIPQNIDGRNVSVAPCEKPAGVVGASGTQVDLLCKAPYNARQTVNYLNERFLRIALPHARADSEIRVFTQKPDSAKYYVVRGLLDTLRDRCEQFQTVERDGVRYHWGIEKAGTGERKGSAHDMVKMSSGPRVYYAWRDEAFLHGTQASLLNEWGIRFGADRFVLLVEFTSEKIEPDPTRKTLNGFMGAKGLKRAAITEWLNNMPSDVQAYIESRRQGASATPGNDRLSKTLLSTWHPQGPASIDMLEDASRHKRNPRIAVPGTPKGGLEEHGPHKDGRIRRRTSRAQADVEGAESDLPGKLKQRQLPFMSVDFATDLGLEPISYQCVPRQGIHELRINVDFPSIKTLLKRAERVSVEEVATVKALISSELASNVNSYIETMGDIPNNDVILGYAAALTLARIRSVDPSLVSVPKRLKAAKDKK